MDHDHFNIAGLEAFAAVMSAGSITGAARLLGRSQPAVTRLIQELEADLGFALFHRNGPRITPTERGVLFHGEVERLLIGLKHMRERATAIAEGEVRSIEIVATPALGAGLVPVAVSLLDGPLVPRQLHIRSTSAEQTVQAVLARSADIGVCSLPIDHPGLEVHWLGSAPCVAVLSEEDPLAAKEVLAFGDLGDRRLVLMSNPYRLQARVDRAFRKAGFTPAAVMVTNASLNAVMAARSGLGVAIIEPATAYGVPVDGTVVRPLAVDIPFLWGVFTAAGKPPSETVEGLVASLEAAGRAVLPGFTRYSPSEMDALKDLLFGSAQSEDGSP